MEGHLPHSLEKLTEYIPEDRNFIHYTCNAPSQEVLDRYGIVSVGNDYGCKDNREVVKIPLKLYLERFSFTDKQSVLIINLENLLRKLK